MSELSTARVDPQLAGQTAVDPAERRALVIGEALIDVVVQADGSRSEHPGGSPANVALGLGRLGRGVDLLTWYAADEHGRAIEDHLKASGVALVPGSDSAGSTSVATGTLDDDGAASYQFDLSWEVPRHWVSPPEPPLVVHTGSIAAVVAPGAADVRHILSAHRPSATITYDPNVRPSLMPPPEVTRDVVTELVSLADVVKVSDEDLAWLCDADPLTTAASWLDLGPALVVVTRGGAGTTALTGRVRVDVPARPVAVADTVGAGDSFMSALIDGLWSADLLGRRHELPGVSEATLRALLQRCVLVAGITVSRRGADPPTRAEVEAAE